MSINGPKCSLVLRPAQFEADAHEMNTSRSVRLLRAPRGEVVMPCTGSNLPRGLYERRENNEVIDGNKVDIASGENKPACNATVASFPNPSPSFCPRQK